ncbi:MAG: endolytic transglycosylase MltG [bacterium]|nr:endolytic transglycosylase MltG [bacterium]
MEDRYVSWYDLVILFIRPILASVFIIGIIFISIFYRLTISSPSDFPIGKYIEIKKGVSIEDGAQFLKDKNIIQSTSMFRLFISLFGETGNIIAGEYRFDKPENLYVVVRNITDTEYKGRALRITIPEGFTNKDIAELIEGKLPNFNMANFLKTALPLEGSLFPDTYIFPITHDEKNVITRMNDNFNTKIQDIKPEIIASKYTRNQIIIMASILEKEARTMETRRTIAGILWKRLEKGMLLQVDASFLYLLNKQSSELTGADLNMDSLYNTYKYKGLPPGAISNPGIDSIIAALRPIQSPYFFYLSDKDGDMHYAVDFEQHKKNKAIYLNH